MKVDGQGLKCVKVAKQTKITHILLIKCDLFECDICKCQQAKSLIFLVFAEKINELNSRRELGFS